MQTRFMRLVIALLCLSAATTLATAGTLTKYWYKGHGALGGWDFRYNDQWGGQNFWCVSSGYDCYEYDWKAIYHYSIGTGTCTPITPAATNNGAYGDYLVATEAADHSIVLPGDLSSAVYSVSCDDNGTLQ